MIERFSVQGYKSLADVTVELGRVNVFVGPNGAGKSNLLEIPALLGAAAKGTIDAQSCALRGMRATVPRRTLSGLDPACASMRLQAHGADATYTLELRPHKRSTVGVWEFVEEQLTVHGSPRLVRDGAKADVHQPKQVGRVAVPVRPTVSAVSQAWALLMSDGFALPSALTSYLIYSPNTLALRGQADGLFAPAADQLLGLNGQGLAEAIESMVGDGDGRAALQRSVTLVDWLDNAYVGDRQEVGQPSWVASGSRVLKLQDRYMAGDVFLNAHEVSEGALYVLFLLTLVGHPDAPPIAAVDNVDQALNPRLARELVRAAQDHVLAHDQAPQLLLTAHNAQVLDGLALRDDRVRLFVVDRDSTGATQVRRITVDQALEAKMKAHNMPLSRLWTEGFLGGMPNL